MEPMYMNMHSYPHQNGQMHYRPRCYPVMEARPPMSYECWPWGVSCGYAPPGACHGCSNHAYLSPHFAYSHIPPHYCPGNHPYFPAQYMPPPPYNVMEHPRYEYEKNVPMEHHCCGCHNHPLHQKEQRNVRIEEEEPEREKGEDNSLVPSQFKNSPYPIVWLPPDYKEFGKVKNKEGGKDASGDEKKEHDNGTLWNGWLPLDLKNAVSSKQRGDGDGNSRQGDEMRNFQFPFFWMPYKPDEGRENQVENANAKQSLETEKGPGGGQNFDVNRGIAGDKSVQRVKDIPVKEEDQHVAKESAGIQENEGDASAKDRTGNGEKKIDNVESLSAKEGSKRKSSSPPKSSKLPPVCLRVDPLPRKKSANTKSRSPSPPGDKQKLEVKSNEAVKVRSSENEEQVKEGTDKTTIAVVDGNTSPEECMNVHVETPGKLHSNYQDDVLPKKAEGKPEEGTAQKHGETGPVKQEQLQDIVSAGGEKEELFGDEEMKTGAPKKCSKRDLSEEEAAVIIQSAYRGYDVRRWEPLKKLKEIAIVREQIADVRRLIQEMELSSNIEGRLKQKTIIAETIMSLLLRLDIIQGLHPSVREIRKSAVRELVYLQEQLDTKMNECSEKQPEQESMMRNGQEDASSKSEDVMLSENSLNSFDLQNQLDGVSNSERAEFSEANPIDEVASSEKVGIDAAERSVDEGVESAQGPTIKDEDDDSSMKLESNESSIAKEDHEAIILGQGSEVSSLQDDLARAADCEPTDDQDSLQGELAELPQGLVDDICGEDGMHGSAVKSDSKTGDYSKQPEEAVIGSPIVQESANEENHQTTETHEASHLQLNGADVETKETGKGGSLDNCNLEYKSVPLEEVDSNIKDTTSEPNESRDEPPENFTADRIETSEASDEREFPATGTYIENIPTNDEPFESYGIADSVIEEPLQSQNMEETGLINGHLNSYDAESTAAENFNDGNDICSVEQGVVSEMGLLNKEGEECNTEHPEATEKQELGDDENNAVESSRKLMEETEKQELGDDENNAVESSRKLMEENERLREMMEKLIKSGQEQLTAISSLSGRVKDLERRLSKKKKLKFRGPRSSCITKFDGSVTM